MKALVHGVERFRAEVFAQNRELFERLAGGQSPQALFITCSDSRVEPSLLTQSSPGDLFVLRNAGNIVPPYAPGPSAEAATIEYALEVLGVSDVVVCGHSRCGAMKALLDGPSGSLPAVHAWLAQAEPTRRVVQAAYGDRSGEERWNVAIQENVLQQLANLRTHPAVAAKLASGSLRAHAWVYKIETGEVFAYAGELGQFRPLGESEAGGLAKRTLGPLAP